MNINIRIELVGNNPTIRNIQTIEEINQLDRKQELPHDGPMSEWSRRIGTKSKRRGFILEEV